MQPQYVAECIQLYLRQLKDWSILRVYKIRRWVLQQCIMSPCFLGSFQRIYSHWGPSLWLMKERGIRDGMPCSYSSHLWNSVKYNHIPVFYRRLTCAFGQGYYFNYHTLFSRKCWSCWPKLIPFQWFQTLNISMLKIYNV